MIQEPQQSETIKIPLINSAESLSKNKLLNNRNKNQSNNKSQTTLFQIPERNSKPRIFLLTRPSKPQLVRLGTQTVQPQHSRNSNLLQLHHPQKTATATPNTVESHRQTGSIRIPFLPRSQVQTSLVKSNTNQLLKKDLKINPVQYQKQTQVKQLADQTLQEKPIILKQIIRLPPSLTETNFNQLQTQQKSVNKKTITKSTAKNLNLSESNTIETQDKAQPEIPLTLASMAGIELTVADMSLLQADMSGAMPPTATVEEINVPVFIDEYLQEATASTTSVTTNNIFNINNNNISNNFSNNNEIRSDIGHEVNNFLDTLEDNFEFDINLLTENSSSMDKKPALEVIEEEQQHLQQQQQRFTELDDDKTQIHNQLELQMMFEKILFDNNNNNSTSTSKNCTTSYNNNNNVTNMALNIDLTDDLFKVAPYTDINDFLSPDDIENSSFGATQFDSEEAVDLNSISKDFSLDECFINSQPTEIMFSSGYSQPLSSSQNIINEISNAEPHIIPKYSTVTTTSEAAVIHMEEYDLNDDIDNFYPYRYSDENSIVDCKESKFLVSNPLKRSHSQTRQHMLEKRQKLRLDTKLCKENVRTLQAVITTPNVIEEIIDQFDEVGSTATAAVDSIKTIYDDLISSSPKCFSVKSEINVDDTTNDFSPPNTPYSVNSISNQTSFINTAPCSPASSIATTSNTSITFKRGRGRPAKTHSDIPDRSQIQHLSESEQKKLLERAKNNEASRKSRLKHKERDTEMEREETELKNRHIELIKEWEKVKKTEKKLKAALKRQYNRSQNDQ